MLVEKTSSSLPANIIYYPLWKSTCISNRTVIGLSKMNRIVEYYAKTSGTRAFNDANFRNYKSLWVLKM
jgi:hypothetical protein